jgi:hypothetical protein
VLGKITMVLVTAAALTAGLTANAFAFSGGVSHVVTHPVAMTTGIVTAMPADPPTAIRRRYVSASAANRSTTGEMLPAG